MEILAIKHYEYIMQSLIETKKSFLYGQLKRALITSKSRYTK